MTDEKREGGVLLYGGGLDSTALLIHLFNKVVPLYALHVDYGQSAYELESEACKFWCDRYHATYDTVRLDLKSLAPGASIVGGIGGDMMDGRNLVLIAAAAMYASTLKVRDVYVGFHKEPDDHPFPDATHEGLDASQAAVNVMFKSRIRVKAPFVEQTRLEIVRKALSREAQFLSHTHTCYRHIRGGCGMCAHCVQKAGYEQQIREG